MWLWRGSAKINSSLHGAVRPCHSPAAGSPPGDYWRDCQYDGETVWPRREAGTESLWARNVESLLQSNTLISLGKRGSAKHNAAQCHTEFCKGEFVSMDSSSVYKFINDLLLNLVNFTRLYLWCIFS